MYYIVSVQTKKVFNYELKWDTVFEKKVSSPVASDVFEIFSSLHKLFSDVPHRIVVEDYFLNIK